VGGHHNKANPMAIDVTCRVACLAAVLQVVVPHAQGRKSACRGEALPSGICLGAPWPPIEPHTRDFAAPPYITTPPPTIQLVGRQLFVDDFLIEGNLTSNVEISYHNATYRDDVNPILAPDQPWEGAADTSTAFASPFSGGMWWDPAAQEFKMWYRCGAPGQIKQCLATSADGINFVKPKFDVVPGTNVVQTDAIDGSTVWLDADPDTPADRRFAMAAVFAREHYSAYSILYSPDGVHWDLSLNRTGPIQDRSSIFLNPMRSPPRWVFSIKAGPTGFGRSRSYWESTDLAVGSQWTNMCSEIECNNVTSAKAWTNADRFDPSWGCGAENHTQLYNLDAVAYESVIVGLFSIFTGKYCASGAGFNRTGEWDSVFLGFSRDGFHWTRPIIDGAHRVFLPMDSTAVHGDNWRWNKANVQSVGGGFTVQRNGPMRFYVGARTGEHQLDGNATAGVAELRRDGFASVAIPRSAASRTTGVLTTRPVQFSGSHFFVNADGTDSMTVAIINAATLAPMAGLGVHDFEGAAGPVSSGDLVELRWAGGAAAVERAAGTPVRLQFRLADPATRIFSFWFAADACGASGGWVAAGGPGYNTSRDIVGKC